MNNKYQPALFWFAVANAITTFLLIGLGGLVTSHEAGMSVPDWPTTYGYNMFLFPVDKWIGGIFYEHSHRLLASVVGFLTTILAVWLFGKDSQPFLRWFGPVIFALGIYLFSKHNPEAPFYCASGVIVFASSFFWPRCEREREWLCWLGIAAFLLVIVQGILGGLRVRWQLDWLGVPHGAVGQTFLVLTAALALFTSRWWIESADKKQIAVPRGLRSHVLYVTILIFVQLLIAATMRHQHAGLAIWDFPAAHGKIWPDTSATAIADYNANRPKDLIGKPITAFQVNLQMVHRLVAYLIFLGVIAAAFLAKKKLGKSDGLTKFAWFWLALLTAQIGLGAWTVWSNKAADITTLHVMVGASALLTGAFWCLIAARRTELANNGKSGSI
jgi:cytochrome c oxidase assembly protein subunit 15